MLFTETSAFTKAVQEILGELDYFELQDLLIDRPDAGDVIPGSKGLRKIRVASGGKGKRGGSRVINYWYVDPEKTSSAVSTKNRTKPIFPKPKSSKSKPNLNHEKT